MFGIKLILATPKGELRRLFEILLSLNRKIAAGEDVPFSQCPAPNRRKEAGAIP
jgi:hypothetical protein